MKLTRVAIESFRGYNKPREFDCLADVVILYGPNGSGKTSFFDAVTWGLFGDITRLRGSRDVVGDSHIRNYFSDSGPQVALHFADGERTSLVTRQKSAVHVVEDGVEYNGVAAEDWIAQQFRPATAIDVWTPAEAERRFLSAHLLGQEDVASFLKVANPRERFDALASLLGVDLVRRFFNHTAGVGKAALAEARDVDGRIAAMRQRIEAIRVENSRLNAGAPEGSVATTERLLEELRALSGRATAAGATVFLPTTSDLAVAADVLSGALELRASLASVVEGARARITEIRPIENELPTVTKRNTRITEIQRQLKVQRETLSAGEKTLAAAAGERDALQRRLLEVRAAANVAKETADEFATFLLSAEPFVHGETCPVCEHSIEPHGVVKRLRERATGVSESLRLLEENRRNLEEQERKLTEQAVHPTAAVEAIRAQIAALEVELRQLDAAATEWRSTLAAAAFSEDPDAKELAAERTNATNRLAAGEQLIREVDGLVAQARFLASEDRRSRLNEEERRLEEELAGAVANADLARASSAVLEGITAAAKASELEIVKRLMLEEKPLLNALYQRLRPHPVLDQLDVDFGEFSNRGEVYFKAVSGDKRPNVSAIFSSAQLNAVAICIFLALNISAGQAQIALLDDPIQNMDDFNVLGLLDLLRSVSEGRQVLVSTHDPQLGALMRRKLRPLSPTRRTITYEFTGYDEFGPRVEQNVDDFREAPEILAALLV